MKSQIAFVVFCVVTVTALSSSLDAADKPKAAARQPAAIKDVSVAEAARLARDTNVVVLDVRTPREFKAGHIAGATNLNFNDRSFHNQLGALDKTRPYLVHCAVGGRSGQAVKTMQSMGFTNIFHLEAGMKGWEKEGQPVVK